MPEEEKFKKAAGGDLKLIEKICAGTWEPVYRFIYYRVQNREEAEDITQETYVKAISYFKRGQTKIDDPVNFLKKVSLNILRDKWRKRKRRGSVVNLDEVELTVRGDMTEESAERDRIRNALERLSKDQRTVIELRIIKGLTVAETARVMNKNDGNVRVLQHRAVQVLNEILKDKDGEREN